VLAVVRELAIDACEWQWKSDTCVLLTICHAEVPEDAPKWVPTERGPISIEYSLMPHRRRGGYGYRLPTWFPCKSLLDMLKMNPTRPPSICLYDSLLANESFVEHFEKVGKRYFKQLIIRCTNHLNRMRRRKSHRFWWTIRMYLLSI